MIVIFIRQTEPGVVRVDVPPAELRRLIVEEIARQLSRDPEALNGKFTIETGALPHVTAQIDFEVELAAEPA